MLVEWNPPQVELFHRVKISSICSPPSSQTNSLLNGRTSSDVNIMIMDSLSYSFAEIMSWCSGKRTNPWLITVQVYRWWPTFARVGVDVRQRRPVIFVVPLTSPKLLMIVKCSVCTHVTFYLMPSLLTISNAAWRIRDCSKEPYFTQYCTVRFFDHFCPSPCEVIGMFDPN